VINWTEDSRAVFAAAPSRIPFQVFRVDAETGRREAWKSIGPSDPSGVFWSWIRMAPNGAYALTIGRYFCDLYLVEGLR
jgi:hypothetical protein